MKITAEQFDYFWLIASIVFCVTVLVSGVYAGIYA